MKKKGIKVSGGLRTSDEQLEASLNELEQDLSKVDISKDPQGYAEMAKRHSDLTQVVDLFNQWKALNSDITDAQELLTEETDQNTKKEYSGTFYIGATTPSFDLETPINSKCSIKSINAKKLNLTSKEFLGAIKQTPPVFSAIKVKGKKLYEYARKGEAIQLKKREVYIYKFKITNINLPLVNFEIICSKGTYIRSIANDFGKELKTGAYLHKLIRTSIGDFKLDDALTIENFEKKIKSG